jgi:hypothetical protein
MTREEAIKWLSRYVGNDGYTDEYQEVCRMAIAALREQDSNANQHVSNTSNALESFNQKTEADTVKGCKLCNSARFDIAAQTRDPDDMYVFSSDPVIGAMFCPLCGRRLEEV